MTASAGILAGLTACAERMPRTKRPQDRYEPVVREQQQLPRPGNILHEDLTTALPTFQAKLSGWFAEWTSRGFVRDVHF